MLKQTTLLTGRGSMRNAKQSYREWLARTATCMGDREMHAEQAPRWTYRPRLDIFLRMRGVPPERVRSAVEFLFRQTYAGWRLLPEDPRGLTSVLDPSLVGSSAGAVPFIMMVDLS